MTFSAKEVFKERTEASATRKTREVEATKRIAATSTAGTETTKLVSLFPLLTILVIFLTLFRITYHVISLLKRLKLRLRLRVVWMQIRVKLLGTFQIRLLHILLRNRLINA